MNQNPQSSEGRGDDDATLSDFLASLMDYTPTIPDELVKHYLAKNGFQCRSIVVAEDALHYTYHQCLVALQHCKN
ncbi:hypothetical protein PHAVU_009G222000 [Phaseolus vulgaris]|uniref:Transcription initiation factor TFIID subunit 10 n=1 Tax=Phaseolus vulgaris TaxID=3885 RepID=V7AY54_PHAVU|nr:hypothetical protein PHAVU_009G222000g [Phaseolus vulgaris]ESW10587.1 hypothetical protein PHAVU_009G222000g [Phaseolus vulgaris]